MVFSVTEYNKYDSCSNIIIFFVLRGFYLVFSIRILYHETAYVDTHFSDRIIQFLMCMLTTQGLVSTPESAQMRYWYHCRLVN